MTLMLWIKGFSNKRGKSTAKAEADPYGMTTRKARATATTEMGDKRTVVRVSRCWEFFASDTLLEQAVDENTL
jgi:hypothetical protein